MIVKLALLEYGTLITRLTETGMTLTTLPGSGRSGTQHPQETSGDGHRC